jgi:hypothetical protein
MKQSMKSLSEILTPEQIKDLEQVHKDYVNRKSKSYDAREVGVKHLSDILKLQNESYNVQLQSNNSGKREASSK